MRYLPYGGTRHEWGHIPTDRRYTGQRWEPSLGLYDYRARYYHPGVERFISPDTLIPNPANPQGLNRYTYVNNNPLLYTDPSGHAINLGAAAIGAVLGATIGAAMAAGPQVIHNLRAGQPLMANIDPGQVAKAAAVGAVAGAVGGLTFGAALAAAPALGLGSGLGAHVAAGAASGAVAGQVARAADNALSGRSITEGLGRPEDIVADAAFGGAGGAAAYGAGRLVQWVAAKLVKRVVFSGHGEYRPGSGMVVVPEGTEVVTYSKFGGSITDELGNAIETGQVPPGTYARVWGPGQKMPDYTLLPPTGLVIKGNPVTVQRPTRLSELLKPKMGRVHWAACTYVPGTKWSKHVWDIR